MTPNNKEPNGCPNCGNFNISGFPYNDESKSRDVECYDCGLLWREIYEFVKYEVISQ